MGDGRDGSFGGGYCGRGIRAPTGVLIFGMGVGILGILPWCGMVNQYHRRSIRLRDYDYSQRGLYFVTICVQNRECILGSIEQKTFYASVAGRLVIQEIEAIQLKHPEISIDSWVVMPNHIHFILEIRESSHKTLGELVRKLKYNTTKQINFLRNSPGTRVWQRNYYEHIIRGDHSLRNIQNYIVQNPVCWTTDKFNPTP